MKIKSFIISVVALCCSMAAQAQTATLQKISGDVTVYYGEAALQYALNNAETSGSVITLSSGGYTRPETITKSVKIYGAGYETDGLIGWAENCTIYKVIVSASVTNNYNPPMGGFIGDAKGSESIYLTDCLFSGSL